MLLEKVSRLVIGTSRTVGSAKKFVRITSSFGGGEFTKTLRKVCTCQKLKFAFLQFTERKNLIDLPYLDDHSFYF
jgi:hypothetical protein